MVFEIIIIKFSCILKTMSWNTFPEPQAHSASYYHAIYIVLTYFASVTDYEDDIFEVISNLHVQGSKFGEKFDKIGGESF